MFDPMKGRSSVRRAADAPEGSWGDLRNFFAGKTNGVRLSIEEINDAIADAGAAAGTAGLVDGAQKARRKQ
ncbi:hypothetical protein [Sphingobium yanoikuyae]|jgi:hypothetical protein|uniref:hypothetical protein n=1 Tax=Sphingobium yanoikuyae TaxID=13690 RepID=UPI00241C2B11|nr:hypothetical protein [Sphingobium yanoikuyae]